MIAVILIAVGILMPFFIGVYMGYKGSYGSPMPTRHQRSDDELLSVKLMKEQVDILDKNRRDSWTNPNYFNLKK